MSPKEKKDTLSSTTILIEAITANGVSRGTGFMFGFMLDQTTGAPLLITNKHVIDNAISLRLRISLSDPKNFKRKVGVATYEITDGLEHVVIPHPSPDLDLAAITLGGIFHHLQSQGLTSYGVMFAENDIATDQELSETSLAESILMIGYPTGLSDEKHNLPIMRQGILASDPQIPFNGKDQFLIDCACYPGSSGSPVLLKEKNIFVGPDGSIGIGRRRSSLLGILFAGPIHTAEGNIVSRAIPTNVVDFAHTKIMINLGYVIPAARILDFKEILKNPSPDGEFRYRFDVTLFDI